MSAESSKQGKKKPKKQRLAAIAVSRQERIGPVIISDEASNSPLNPEGVQDEPNAELPKKNTRGKAKSLAVTNEKGKESSIVVDFNEKDQPIGEKAAQFSSFLGISARGLVLVPLTVEWDELSEEFRNQLWEHVTRKFKLDDCRKKYTFSKLRKYCREFKSKTMKMLMENAQGVGLPCAAALLKPDNVTTEEWLAFIKKRTSLAAREKCEKFKKMRAKQTILHRTSRKSLARVEDEMASKRYT